LLNQVNNSSSYQDKTDDMFSNFLDNNISQTSIENEALFNFEMSETSNVQNSMLFIDSKDISSINFDQD